MKMLLVEWHCKACSHTWYEISHVDNYPEVCPECGQEVSPEHNKTGDTFTVGEF